MSKTNDADISNAELLEAINTAFTTMQQQIDERFEGVAAQFEGVASQSKSMQEHIDERFDENANEHAAMNQKFDNTIDRLDDHDRRLEALETKTV